MTRRHPRRLRGHNTRQRRPETKRQFWAHRFAQPDREADFWSRWWTAMAEIRLAIREFRQDIERLGFSVDSGPAAG